jgi:hypothetical protein
MTFEVAHERSAGATVTEPIIAKINTQFTLGAACKIVQGHLEICGATDKASHIYEALETLASQVRPATADLSHATLPQIALCIPIQGRDLIIKSAMKGAAAPPIDGTSCNTNATTSLCKVTYGTTTANDDFTGGTVYCVELNQTRRIASSTYAGGVHTLNLDTPFTQGPEGAAVALTTSHSIRVVPFAKGSTAVKFLAGGLLLDTSVAGKSGGQNKIEGVDLASYTVYSSAPYLS